MEELPFPAYAPSDPRLRMARAEKRIEANRKLKQEIQKEIENVNKNEKYYEQQMALLRCKRDCQKSKRIKKELEDMKQRREFLKSPLMLKRCNDAIAENKRGIEHLKYSEEVEYGIQSKLQSLSISKDAK